MTTLLGHAADLDKPEVIPAPGGWWAGLNIPRPSRKLDPVIKARWIADLTSGNIRQAQSTLRKKVKGTFAYCCIGVLCNTIGHRKGWFLDASTSADPGEFGWRHFGARDTTELADVAGFPDSNVLSFLAGLNDEGATFAQIAVWVGKYL